MGMSGMYGPADRAESIATLHAALDAGITLLDTGDFYGMGHNELLIREGLASRNRDELLLSVKFGALRDPAQGWGGYDARPAAVKNFLAYSLQRLGVDHIDIYRPARLDPNVPIEDTVGAIGDMIKAGYVRYVGLSEVGASTLRRAQAVHPICRSSTRSPHAGSRPRYCRCVGSWESVLRLTEYSLADSSAVTGRASDRRPRRVFAESALAFRARTSRRISRPRGRLRSS